MANAQVLLLEHIEKLGGEGDTVNVKAGYARNFLLPQKLAMLATHGNRKQIEALQKRKEARVQREQERAAEMQSKLESLSVAIPVKTGKQGDKIQIFGSITAHTLMDRFKEEGIELEAKQFHFAEAVKSLGKHTVKIKLGANVSVDFSFEVVSENPIEETEA